MDGLYVASWGAPGYCCSWKAYILAEDNVEAEYFWHMHLKEDADDKYTWSEGKRSCCGHASIEAGTAKEAEEFAKLYLCKRKKGVYKCEPTYYSGASDHLWD